MAKIGILGGTFDPIHNGHFQLAHSAKTLCELDRVVFIPAFHPPHKNIEQLTPFHHRVEMLKLAIDNITDYYISTIEEKLLPPTYTIDMLHAFQEEQKKGDEFFFIIGVDAFLEIQSWKQYGEVLNTTHFIVCLREGYTTEELHLFLISCGYATAGNLWESSASRFHIYYFDYNIIDVSSSTIRAKIAEGDLGDGFLAESVNQYIQVHGLYNT